MARTVPSHIAAANMNAAPLSFAWDAHDPTGAFRKEVPRLQYLVSDMSTRASVLLAAGCAQWVAFRLDAAWGEPTLFDAIDCARACVVDVAYTDPDTRIPHKVFDGSHVRQPIPRGPGMGATRVMGETIDQLCRHEAAEHKVAFMSNLAELVVPNKKKFRDWRKWAIDRLIELDPYSTDDLDGKSLPIEALDPSANFEPKQTKTFLREFLENLDWKTNQFLRPPAEMKKAGFKGKPYEL